MDGLARGLAQTLRGMTRSMRAGPLAGVTVDQTEPCDSGSIRVQGTINDNGTGSVSLTFNACRTGDETVSGEATAQVNAFDTGTGTLTDFVVTFARLMVRGSGVSVDFGGSIRLQESIATNTETLTVNFVVLDNITANMLKAENLVFMHVANNVLSPSSFTESISGRLYDKAEGFVDISTPAPFYFGSATQDFPDSGQMVLRGANNASIRLTALSSPLITIALDLNGDGTYENTATLKWTDLGGPVGADLRDSDGDGMHNSWETANGLDPNNAADANLDRDGDGASNKAEYLAGTNPNNPSDGPPAVGLTLTMSASPIVNVRAGSILTYTISVMNGSSGPANDVVVTDFLPPGVSFVSATTTLGSCSGSTSFSCNLGTLTGFNSATITLAVTPTVEGVINNTANVSSSSRDTNYNDNSASFTTIVGQPATGIQALIDSALPGATVTIAPGLYVGSLDFGGKNITLQSRDGPATTIISGGSPAVQIGPGGALQGFTIAAASGSFGAGVVVVGTGAVISGNIFDGNSAQSGGTGAGVFGNGASATIERNIFRNNSCDSQYLSGVIAFINGTSSRIVNNVFENNPCAAVNMTLPQGYAPVVENNTFIANRVAIHVDRRVPQVTQIYRNNVFVNNGTALEIVFGSSDADNPVWTNNLVFGNTTDYVGTANQTNSNGNISGDPLFVDLSGGNYHLQTGSPAIDAGSPSGAPTVDFDGLLRPRDGNGDGITAIDIGAFEF